jgi:uncharacterized membrane protein YvlD (DUF360 family)
VVCARLRPLPMCFCPGVLFLFKGKHAKEREFYMQSIISLILSFALLWVVGAAILMIVSRLGLGLKVDGFLPAFIASAVISVVAGVVTWLLGLFGIQLGAPTLLGAIVSLLVSAVVLLISGNLVKGLSVNGFSGALIAAIAYGAVAWLLGWLLNFLFV